MLRPETITQSPQSYQTYLMLSLVLAKTIPNFTKTSLAPLEYKALQHAINDDDGWTMVEHLLVHCDPYLSAKEDGLQKQTSDLNIIPGEYLVSFINIGALFRQNIII